MSQSINFIKSLPKPSNRLSALMIALAVPCALVFLLLVSLVTKIVFHDTYNELETAKQQLADAQAAYNKLATMYPILASDTPMIDLVKQLETRFHEKNKQVAALEHLLIRRGFSIYLAGLAQSTPNTVWFDQIQVDNDAMGVTLTGFATKPDAVPELMGRLLATPGFERVPFNLFFVKAIKNRPYMRFSIATHTLGSSDVKKIEEADHETKKSKKTKE